MNFGLNSKTGFHTPAARCSGHGWIGVVSIYSSVTELTWWWPRTIDCQVSRIRLLLRVILVLLWLNDTCPHTPYIFRINDHRPTFCRR